MRRARADRFESASAAAKPSPFHGVVFRNTKKPDMYWSAPRGAKRPVISALEIGYVRRSEFSGKKRATSRTNLSQLRRAVWLGRLSDASQSCMTLLKNQHRLAWLPEAAK